MEAYTRGPCWLTHEAVCKARRAADGCADGLIQPAGFAGNSGKNSGFRQTGPRPPQLLPPKLLQIQGVDGKSPLQAEQRGNSPAGFERGEQRAFPMRRPAAPAFFAPESASPNQTGSPPSKRANGIKSVRPRGSWY